MDSGNNVRFFYGNANPLSVTELGNTLVVAPHQDDESLGCGGTISLLRKAELPVHVIFVSDGSMSHPGSRKYPAEVRIAMREAEAIEALQILGVAKDCISFMRLQDSMVPDSGNVGFEIAVATFIQLLKHLQPATVLLPWRRDPHKDHRATWQIVYSALADYQLPVRMLEYFIWLWERSQPQDLPQDNEAAMWQVNIDHAIAIKQKAIMAHTSQVTSLIDDDPNGFTLSPEVLAHFSGSNETFAEVLKHTDNDLKQIPADY